MIDQIGACWAACVAAIPSKAISVAVSNPNPNRKPTKYMCQLSPTSLNSARRTRAIHPGPLSMSCKASSSQWLPFRAA